MAKCENPGCQDYALTRYCSIGCFQADPASHAKEIADIRKRLKRRGGKK